VQAEYEIGRRWGMVYGVIEDVRKRKGRALVKCVKEREIENKIYRMKHNFEKYKKKLGMVELERFGTGIGETEDDEEEMMLWDDYDKSSDRGCGEGYGARLGVYVCGMWRSKAAKVGRKKLLKTQNFQMHQLL
jgi:hypothetical protein